MALPFPNEYHLRSVAEASSKACIIDFKPSTKVLITPDNKDFFYICASHLQDRGFASPKTDPKAEAEKKDREALQQEIELVKKEYEEKQKKKSKKKSKKDDDDGGKKEDEAEKKERDDKIKALEERTGLKSEDDSPRIFVLHKDIYNMRINRIRQIEIAKRNQARLKDPMILPAAPRGDIS